MGKLDIGGLASGLGVSWGAAMLFVGWTSTFGWGANFVAVMSSIYIGFAPTLVGGIIGAIWGLVDGAIGGALIALVYNATAGKRAR